MQKNAVKSFIQILSSLVYSNSNITLPVVDCIENLYQIYGAGLHKIRFDLKNQHNIEISHQSIENILLNSNYQFNHENWTYLWFITYSTVFGSKLMEFGYYIFSIIQSFFPEVFQPPF